ncbi:hypothetical protein TNIN_133461 [Trichonephila inaurata madagascariensis]|uniref:Uncharacterized protein n=1 Tax=Trichonephila inaurata madagascariensis TaxID=2747483 RepID=A0A8X6XC88_9ARAC|nr:hypothetical protein TNIN_133461 [Trichonephila inaurata madagascariensis]
MEVSDWENKKEKNFSPCTPFTPVTQKVDLETSSRPNFPTNEPLSQMTGKKGFFGIPDEPDVQGLLMTFFQRLFPRNDPDMDD